MSWDFTQISNYFFNENKGKLLVQGNFGIERECQRILPNGDLALSPHPTSFGDKTKNPRITNDFSESQIEMITPPFNTVEEVYSSLAAINTEVGAGIADELLWPLSMPPNLPDEENIPIACFPGSENGRDMEIYRNGLALRYGKKMQMISGIHYNFSFSQEMIDDLHKKFGNRKDKRLFIDEIHFGLARNFLRYNWILIYLFGASPFCHNSYYPVIKKELTLIQECCPNYENIIENCLKCATSLRVSRFGYSNNLNANIHFNSLEEYSTKIRRMLSTEDEKFSKLGIYRNGSQIQLNGNVLQKESEFYSLIRLKQATSEGETPLEALEKKGVNYVEIRNLDLNPFEKLGLSIEQMNFLHIFMHFCLFEESPLITDDEHELINLNHHLISLIGRKNELSLKKYDGSDTLLGSWGEEIFEKLKIIANLMDKDNPDNKYVECVEKEYYKLFDIALLPSEMISNEMLENNEDFLTFGIRYAKNYSKKSLDNEYHKCCFKEADYANKL